MKTLYSTLVLILFSLCAYSQVIQRDTIFVTTNNTTTLLFPQAITLCDIGSFDDYGFKKNGNVLLLKAAGEDVKPTSIIVQYGDNKLLHSTLAYAPVPKELFIQFKEEKEAGFPNETRVKASADSVKDLTTKVVEKRLSNLVSDTKIEYKTIANIDTKENIGLTLQNIIQDSEHLYLKVLFINKSKIDYGIDMVEYVFRDPVKDGKTGWQRHNVYATATNNIDQIKAKDMKVLGFAVPRFTVSKKGEFMIVVREKNGTRSLSLIVPYDVIFECKSIK